MKRLSAFIIVCALCALLCACVQKVVPEATASGEGIPGQSYWSDTYTGIYLHFAEDGILHYIQNGTEVWVPCEVLDDRIIVSYDSANREEIAYTLEGDTLTVTWTDGAETTLTRIYAEEFASAPATELPQATSSLYAEPEAEARLGYIFRETAAAETVFAENITSGSLGDFQMILDKDGIPHAVYKDDGGNLNTDSVKARPGLNLRRSCLHRKWTAALRYQRLFPSMLH